MKAKKMKKVLVMLLVILAASGSTNVMPVSAGVSESAIDSSAIGDELDKSTWANPSGDVTAKSGEILFPAGSTEETRLITKTMARADDALVKLASVKADLQFANIPEGKEFVVAFGLKSVEAVMGDSGNIEIIFQKQGRLQVFVTAYGKDGESTELAKAVSIENEKQVKLDAVLNADGKLTVSVNGKKICDAVSPISGEGRIGFLQTGSCEVKISNLEVATCKNETPNNCNISEDFENGTLNRNSLISLMTISNSKRNPSRLCIQEYEGNQVLMWENVTAGYLGTKYKYSNFELTFDVPYLTRTNVVDEDGNIVKGRSEGIGIAYGCEASECSGYGYQSATDMVLIRSNSKVESVSNGKFSGSDPDYPVFDAEKGKAFSVKVSMKDSVITVYLKWMEETEYRQILQYQLTKETPAGYIQIWSTGSGNFAIDNLKIVNTDQNAKLEEVSYESAKIEKTPDFVYEPLEKVFVEVEEENFPWLVLIPIVAGVCAVTLGTLTGIKVLRQKRRKDGVVNEK